MRNYDHGGDIYAEGKRPVDFSVNINPLGMPKAASDAAVKAVREELTYPDPFCRKLTAALSERYGIPEKDIICGNGASDLMMRLCSWLEPSKVLVPAPGFSEYRRCSELFGADVAEFTVLAEGTSPMESIISKALSFAPELIFICRPNNPDGSLMSLAEVEKLARFCEKRGIVLAVDECFLEFTEGESAAGLTGQFRKLIVMNAFTKTYAMAGLRLGFMFCSDEELLDGCYGMGSPWSVSVAAQAAGEACCSETEHLAKSRAYIAGQRKKLVSGLEKLGLDVFPSEANFVLVKGREGLRQALAERNIKVRDCRNFSGLDDSYMRLGIRTEEENKALLCALEDIING